MITINNKEYDEDEFTSEQRKTLRTIQQIETLIAQKRFDLAITDQYHKQAVNNLVASLEQEQEGDTDDVRGDDQTEG